MRGSPHLHVLFGVQIVQNTNLVTRKSILNLLINTCKVYSSDPGITKDREMYELVSTFQKHTH